MRISDWSSDVCSSDLCDCTPYLDPRFSDPWSGSITRNPLNQDTTSTTRAAYLFDTIELSEQFQVNAGIRLANYRISGDYTPRGGSLESASGESLEGGRGGKQCDCTGRARWMMVTEKK